MHLLESGVDCSVIALWLGHETMETTQIYLLRALRLKNAPLKDNILGPRTDGIDIDSSQKVTIRNCYISVNDDNIALKGSKGPLADQDKDSPPMEDILVENCEFGDGNGMLTCGSEATLVRNVTVKNCRITRDATMLTLKLRPDTLQHCENILINGIPYQAPASTGP
jgi:polygalacturonase